MREPPGTRQGRPKREAGETLQNEILNQIEHGSAVYTDSATSYYDLAAQQYIHETVTHVEEYVRGNVHTQGIENSGVF